VKELTKWNPAICSYFSISSAVGNSYFFTCE